MVGSFLQGQGIGCLVFITDQQNDGMHKVGFT